RKQALPLSFAQQRLWFLQEFEAEKALYNVPMVARLRGELRPEILKRAIKEIVRRHEALRTRFEVVNGEPVQVIEAAVAIELPVIDLRGMEDEEKKKTERSIVERQAHQEFDLRRSPLLRAVLVQTEEQEHVLV